jgi:hypothetical protein
MYAKYMHIETAAGATDKHADIPIASFLETAVAWWSS